jgi:hypothetical protein
VGFDASSVRSVARRDVAEFHPSHSVPDRTAQQ